MTDTGSIANEIIEERRKILFKPGIDIPKNASTYYSYLGLQ